MRRTMTVTLLIVLLVAGIAEAKVKKYGKGVSKGEYTKISTILADPEAYNGKVVRVEGTAVGVCAHRGCWLTLASDVEGQTIRFKVEDGVIIFPKEIVGETVKGEGVFTINKVETICDATKPGEAEEKCETFYQISGTGAKVNWDEIW